MFFYLINVILRLLDVYSFILIVYALLSWFPGAYQTLLGRLILAIVDPLLKYFRRLPLQFGGIDFTVLVAIIAIQFAERIVIVVANWVI